MTGSLVIGSAGRVGEEVLDAIVSAVASWSKLPVRRHSGFEEPLFAYDVGRGQYSSTYVLHMAEARLPADAGRFLVVTELDLFIPMLTFVFGQAQLGGRVALVSVARLRPEFYDQPADGALLAARAGKEAVHELGHTLGLTHCPDPRCVMSLSVAVAQVDLKKESMCRNCAGLAEEVLRAEPAGEARSAP